MRIGIDILEVERVKPIAESPERMRRMFTKHELEYFKRKNNALETIAGHFSAKEALFKALGKGMTPNYMLDVEVIHDHYGAPMYHLSARFLKEKNLNISKIELSISHTKQLSVAVCIMVHKDPFV